MKNIQILFIAFITLFLFACDSSSSGTKATVTPGTFNLGVKVVGLNGDLVIKNVNDNKTLNFSVDDTKIISNELADLTDYDIQVDSLPLGQGCLLGSNAKGKIDGVGVVVEITCSNSALTGNIQNGKLYYNNNCSDCHRVGSAGADDSFAFASSSTMDLVDNYDNRVTNSLPELIKPDMHRISIVANLMGDFQAVSDQEIADLIAYINSLRVVP